MYELKYSNKITQLEIIICLKHQSFKPRPHPMWPKLKTPKHDLSKILKVSYAQLFWLIFSRPEVLWKTWGIISLVISRQKLLQPCWESLSSAGDCCTSYAQKWSLDMPWVGAWKGQKSTTLFPTVAATTCISFV